jgi:hypothetical protein
VHDEGRAVVNAHPFGGRHADADDFNTPLALLLRGGGLRRLPGQAQAYENRDERRDAKLDSFYRSLILHHLNLLDYSLCKVYEAD